MFKSLPQMLQEKAGVQPEKIVLYSKDSNGQFYGVSYNTLYTEVLDLAESLKSSGITQGSPVGLVSENRREWLVTDLGILSLGAADVPRGNDATPGELTYILKTTEAQICFAETKTQAEKILSLAKDLPNLRIVVVFDEAGLDELVVPGGLELVGYKTFLSRGTGKDHQDIEQTISQIQPKDLATIIFTSGTTGIPKGVMLSHEGFLNQVKHVPDLLKLKPEDIWLCVLPVWHVFERVMQYVALGNNCALAYSKPQGKILLADLASLRPTWMASVPRIWEALRDNIYAQVKKQSSLKQSLFHFFVNVGSRWSKLRDLVYGWVPEFRRRIRFLDTLGALVPWLLLTPLKILGDILVFKGIHEKLGGRFVAGISGGGALPPVVDQFFAAAGILLLEGYGITETSPVLGVRHQSHPYPETVGSVFPEMEVQIRSLEGHILPPGQKGHIFARGPQVMLGYYKNPQLTAQVMDENGWFNTGDLGMMGFNQELKILGRAKDTVVLRGGENVEPYPLESKLKESAYIQEAVVVGQDQKFLGALIVPSSQCWEAAGVSPSEENAQALRPLLADEISRRICPAAGFKDFERILRFCILPKAFEVDKELSAKQEIKRHTIQELYAKEISVLYN